MKIEIESNNRELLAHLQSLQEKVAPAAISRSLNRTANHVIKITRSEVAKEAGIPQKVIRKRFRRKNSATVRRLRAQITIGTYEIPVNVLSPKPRKLKGKGTVKYKTLPGQPLDQSAFIARGKRGETVFARKSGDRLPIRQKTINVAPLMRRRMWSNLGQPAKRFFDKTYFQDMDGRILRDLQKRGMTVR